MILIIYRDGTTWCGTMSDAKMQELVRNGDARIFRHDGVLMEYREYQAEASASHGHWRRISKGTEEPNHG